MPPLASEIVTRKCSTRVAPGDRNATSALSTVKSQSTEPPVPSPVVSVCTAALNVPTEPGVSAATAMVWVSATSDSENPNHPPLASTPVMPPGSSVPCPGAVQCASSVKPSVAAATFC